jgi:hypothetical protein
MVISYLFGARLQPFEKDSGKAKDDENEDHYRLAEGIAVHDEASRRDSSKAKPKRS